VRQRHFARCKGSLVVLEQALARGSKAPHRLRDTQVADPKLAEHGLHVLAEAVHELLGERPPCGALAIQAVEDGKKVQRKKAEAPLKRVRNAETPIENREPRLRHNRAIEFFGGARLGAPAHQAVERVHVRGHFSVCWHCLAACVCTGFIEGQVAVLKDEPISIWSKRPLGACLAASLLASALTGCGAQIDRHGHVFMDIDLAQVQPGMSKDQVMTTLGSPDTTSSINGEAYYYISTTQKSYAFFKPWEIDRKVVAVYFDRKATVENVAQYGLKDGIVVRYAKDETPARGKDLGVLEQIFGNISQRKVFKDQRQGAPGSIPGSPGPY
jgi:outer membrane protein assembly factor BamE (lipoprotein component of BamABCDE complex)